MIETLVQARSANNGGGSELFVGDGALPGFTVVATPGLVFETPPSIDGATLLLTQDTDSYSIVFNQNVNLRDTDWTLEWSAYNTDDSGGYYSEIHLLPLETSLPGATARYGDAGFGNRMQFGGYMNSLQVVYNSSLTRALLKNTLRRYALVSRNKNVTFFCDGVQQQFAQGTSYTYNIPSFQLDSDLSIIRRLVIGQANWGGPATKAKRGRIRLSLFARYIANYSPEPF